MIGKKVVTRKDLHGDDIRTEHSLINADRIRALPIDSALLLHRNLEPVKLRTLPYYQQRVFQRQAAIPPVRLPVRAPTELKRIPLT